MKKILFLAALVAAGCTKTDVEIPVEPKANVITLTASIPADEPETRISFETTQATPHGLRLKWESEDKLMLNFKQGDTYYRAEAAIDANSISPDGKTARFTLALPQQISLGQPFDLYGVYQKTVPPEIYIDEEDGTEETYDHSGYIEDGTNNYILEGFEENCITLDKMSTETPTGIIRPVLWFKQTDVTNIADIVIDLRHLGWIMAVHLDNASDEEMKLPVSFHFDYQPSSKTETSPIWNAAESGEKIAFNMTDGSFQTQTVSSVQFNINRYDWALYDGTVASGESIVLYRWLVNDENATTAPLKPKIDVETADGQIKTYEIEDTLPAKKVERGKVYHVYILWDGENFMLP